MITLTSPPKKQPLSATALFPNLARTLECNDGLRQLSDVAANSGHARFPSFWAEAIGMDYGSRVR